jgi:hypothetical protein
MDEPVYVEAWPGGGYAVRLAGHPVPISRHDTEAEADAKAAAYLRGLRPEDEHQVGTGWGER